MLEHLRQRFTIASILLGGVLIGTSAQASAEPDVAATRYLIEACTSNPTSDLNTPLRESAGVYIHARNEYRDLTHYATAVHVVSKSDEQRSVIAEFDHLTFYHCHPLEAESCAGTVPSVQDYLGTAGLTYIFLSRHPEGTIRHKIVVIPDNSEPHVIEYGTQGSLEEKLRSAAAAHATYEQARGPSIHERKSQDPALEQQYRDAHDQLEVAMRAVSAGDLTLDQVTQIADTYLNAELALYGTKQPTEPEHIQKLLAVRALDALGDFKGELENAVAAYTLSNNTFSGCTPSQDVSVHSAFVEQIPDLFLVPSRD